MKKVLIGVALAAALGAGGAWWWHQARTVAMVKDRVLQVLTDPTSAEFKAITHNRQHDTGCGFVNASNKLGGMVGYRAFVAFPDGEVRFQPESLSPERKTWYDAALVYCDAGDTVSPFWEVMFDPATSSPK